MSAASSISKTAKVNKLKSITGDSSASQDRWYSDLGNRNSAGIKKYGFNWKTDGCSWAPDTLPGGYDFKFPCWRHDFGYRNFKKTVGTSKFHRDHKKRVDKAFLRDMRSVCNRFIWADPYPAAARKRLKAACFKTATKYYNTVKSFN